MIDIEKLKQVRIVVTHRYAEQLCPDGAAAALILKNALPEAKVIFTDHGKDLEDLAAEPNMLFCDITPAERRVGEFVEAGAIVLDHHEKQKHIVEAFGTNGVYSDKPGDSGAVLAFKHVWSPLRGDLTHDHAPARAYEFARLAGIRDTWQTKSPDWNEASAQAKALTFYPWEMFLAIDDPFSAAGHDELTQLLALGEVLLMKHHASVRRLQDTAFGFNTHRGTRVMVVPSYDTSDVAERTQGPDVVVGFVYNAGPDDAKITLSCRSRTGYDVGAFCVSLGGGGHKPAAGATLAVKNGDLNPYEFIAKLLNEYESQA